MESQDNKLDIDNKSDIEINKNINIQHNDDNIKITIDNTIYQEKRNYLKNLILYLKISNLFINGFYKSLIHSIYPDWYKDEINEIVIKLQSILLKKKC